MIKSQKGITLIALVITIIVLLILAGVSIAMLTGPNGLLTRANDSKIEQLKAEAVERANMEGQAQYANALAGRAFDSIETIEANLEDASDEIQFEVSEPSADTGVRISFTITGASVTKNTAEVKKEADKWVFEGASK